MITIIYGDDYNAKINQLNKIKEISLFEKIDAFKISVNDLDNAVRGVSFFEDKKRYIVSNTKEIPDLWEYIYTQAENIKNSETLDLIILENVLTKEEVEFLLDKVSTLISCIAKSEVVKPIISPFIISDAIFNRDKKEIWISYYKLIELGTPIEDIENAIIWALKNLVLVSETRKLSKNNQELDIKPFVLQKIEKGLSHWKRVDVLKTYNLFIDTSINYKFYDDYQMYLEKKLLEIF